MMGETWLTQRLLLEGKNEEHIFFGSTCRAAQVAFSPSTCKEQLNEMAGDGR